MLIAFFTVFFSLAESPSEIKLKYHEALGEMASLSNALDDYKKDCKAYPTTVLGLENLVNLREGVKTCPQWNGPYIDDLQKDPFGRPYIYESDGSYYLLETLGKDLREGGDSLNWDLIITSGTKANSGKWPIHGRQVSRQ